MIGKLTGTVVHQEPDSIIVDVSGVGYKVSLPVSFQPDNAREGDDISLFIHTHVREDAIILFGFPTYPALVLFEKLISVNGIGPKLAQAILAALGSDKVQQAIAAADVAQLTTVSGVGKKTAERIILELKGKLPEDSKPGMTGEGQSTSKREFNDAFEALLALGYSQSEVKKALGKVARELPELTDSAQIVRASLKYM